MTAITPATPLAAIRPATPSDWGAIAELLDHSALPLAGAREHVDHFVVAERDGVIVGCAAIERYGEAGLLRSVAVHDSARGSGLGVRLAERCIADAESLGMSTLILLTTTADRFFPRFGFRVVDRASVPEGVRESVEFRGACPSSATVMRLDLRTSKLESGDAVQS